MRLFTTDVSKPMTIEKEVEDKWIRPKKGIWATTLIRNFGGTVMLMQPVDAREFYQCPDCFAMFIKAVMKGSCGRRSTLVPFNNSVKPTGMLTKGIDDSGHAFSKHCQCDAEPMRIKNYEELGEAFDLYRIQVESMLEC